MMPTMDVTAPDGTHLHVAEAGPADGPLVVLLHGFPELGYSWRHQIPALAGAGFRLLVPDLRGFGRSGVPEATEAYAVDVLARDVLALIDAAGRDDAIVIGHDWGADVAWKTAWMHPERVSAVAGLSVPFIPRAPAPPLAILREHAGADFYIVFFTDPDAGAEEALARDVRRTLTATEVWTRSWAERTGDDATLPAHLSEEELAVYVEAFERTGFGGGLSYYRNLDRNWERTEPFETRRIEQPAFFLTGERDPVKAFMPAAAMEGWVTDLRAQVEVPGAGHWVNQEEPGAVNDALLAWLGGL
jgi:pimeloyl-ACP methyl ester carboxylesterase